MPDKSEPKHAGGRPPLPEGQVADAQVQLRVSRRRKAAWTRKAQMVQGRTLSAWITGLCDRDAGFQD